MVNGIFQPPTPHNEPVKGYVRGSPERAELEAELARQMSEVIEIPCIINGEEVWTNNVVEQVMPHNHGHVLARVHLVGEKKSRMLFKPLSMRTTPGRRCHGRLVVLFSSRQQRCLRAVGVKKSTHQQC